MQAKDITDDAFLEAMEEARRQSPCTMVNRWDVGRILAAPDKVVLAKARTLIRRGVIRGCWCGCRGDFELPEWSYMTAEEAKDA